MIVASRIVATKRFPKLNDINELRLFCFNEITLAFSEIREI